MKALLVATLTLLMSSTALARPPLSWNEVEYYNDVYLTQELRLAPNVVIEYGSQLRFLGVMGIPYTNAFAHDYVLVPCLDPKRTSEMELILPEEEPVHPIPGRDRSVGVQLMEDCHLEVYIEGPDYDTPSFLRE